MIKATNKFMVLSVKSKKKNINFVITRTFEIKIIMT